MTYQYLSDMPSQDEYPVSDASDTRQILTPVSENSGIGNDGLGSGGKKRKRDGNTMEDLLKDTFAVTPYPSTSFFKPRSLQPLMLLHRSHLPLSSLSIASSSILLPQSRLFEAHVKILELEERMGSQPMVLIARLDDGRTLYAVEREGRGRYVLCQLGSWVNLQQLRTTAVVSLQETEMLNWSLAAPRDIMTAPLNTSGPGNYSKKKRLAIEAIQSMVKRPSASLLTGSQTPTEQEAISDLTQDHPPATLPLEDPVAQPTSNDIFETVRNQYFEALYLSKASLAYFAKGPLSRARAAFHLDYDSTLDMNEYIIFLESLVMSTTLIDKKYKDGIPGCVSLIDISHSADDADQMVGKAKKRRANKKMKPGKTGLYPAEDNQIRKWWATHDDEADSGSPDTSKEEMTRRRISQLRIRETQLQMIIMLEVLALQQLVPAPEDMADGLPLALPRGSGADEEEKPIKSKKPDRLTMLIDVHIDRLCIWQSIALESVKTPVDGATRLNDELGGLMKHTDNILRDFCVEVIVPFFSARLPDRCAAISRKLGGPVVVSPQKQKAKSSSFSGAPSRPGAATKRPVPAKPRPSLQRIRTNERERRNESRGPNSAISLMRSASTPILPGLKREGSEAPSLSNIPSAEPQPLHANRGGVLNSKRFSKREVDFKNLAPDLNSKAKRKVKIDAELREAISALKRPNRELAGKAFAETAEQRSASISHSRKSKKPIRNPLFQGVQISATPKANRKKSISAESEQPSLPKMSEEMDSLPRIPQSVARSSQDMQARNPLFSSLQATPTRKPIQASSRRTNGILGVNVSDYGGPSQQRYSSSQFENVVPESAVKLPSNLLADHGVEETPIKKKVNETLGHSHPRGLSSGSDKENGSAGAGLTRNAGTRQKIENFQQDSIYKALGWDDADDIDELA